MTIEQTQGSPEQLYSEIKRCTRCPKTLVRHGHIWYEGQDGTVLFVAMQPSWKGHPDNPERTVKQKVFDDFWDLKATSGLGRYRFTNFVKCATDNASEEPNFLEIVNCIPWLEREVKLFKTRYVVVVGKNWYDRWKDYLENTLHVRHNWCYHYSGRVANQPWYLENQQKQFKQIHDEIQQLSPHVSPNNPL